MNDPIENCEDYSRTEPLRLTVPDSCGGRRIDQILAELLPQHSRNRLQAWVRDGLVTVDGVLDIEPKHKLMGGEKLLISEPVDATVLAEKPEATLDPSAQFSMSSCESRTQGLPAPVI